jgi:hypothetical protein
VIAFDLVAECHLQIGERQPLFGGEGGAILDRR